MIGNVPWSASTRPQSNSLPKRACRSRRNPDGPAGYDYEYRRNGTANLFMMFAPLEGWRHVKVTDRHTAMDYAAQVLKELSRHALPRFSKNRARPGQPEHAQARLRCTKPFPPPKPAGSSNGSSGTTHQNTGVGSTWRQI